MVAEFEVGGGLSPHPEKPLHYFSPMILARRRRLLKETRRMISEDGLEKFSVRKLCQRADVAQRTLYNAFQNKDRLIAFAIREAFDEYRTYIGAGTDPASLGAMIGRTIAINRRNFQSRNYTRAICAIYFAPATPPDVWQTIRDMAHTGNGEWLARNATSLNPWIDADHLNLTLVNVQYATINDWCQGRLSDEEYLPRLIEGMLFLIVAATHGPLAEEARRYLEEIKRTGDVKHLVRPIAEAPPVQAAADSGKQAPARPRRARKTG